MGHKHLWLPQYWGRGGDPKPFYTHSYLGSCAAVPMTGRQQGFNTSARRFQRYHSPRIHVREAAPYLFHGILIQRKLIRVVISSSF